MGAHMGKKIYLIGMDGFIVPMARLFASEGTLPNISWLIENGSSNQILPSLPAWTQAPTGPRGGTWISLTGDG